MINVILIIDVILVIFTIDSGDDLIVGLLFVEIVVYYQIAEWINVAYVPLEVETHNAHVFLEFSKLR